MRLWRVHIKAHYNKGNQKKQNNKHFENFFEKRIRLYVF